MFRVVGGGIADIDVGNVAGPGHEECGVSRERLKETHNVKAKSRRKQDLDVIEHNCFSAAFTKQGAEFLPSPSRPLPNRKLHQTLRQLLPDVEHRELPKFGCLAQNPRLCDRISSRDKHESMDKIAGDGQLCFEVLGCQAFRHSWDPATEQSWTFIRHAAPTGLPMLGHHERQDTGPRHPSSPKPRTPFSWQPPASSDGNGQQAE